MINLVIASGVVKSLALRFDNQARPELRFTLEHQENGFSLWLPCCANGATAERLASEIEDGLHVLITSGKLCYRKRTTKAGEQSRLEILVWQVDRLDAGTPEPHDASPAYDSVSDHGALLTEASRPVAEENQRTRAPKARRPRPIVDYLGKVSSLRGG